MYILIAPDEDGNPVRYLTEKELKEYLQKITEYKDETIFLDKLPKETDANYWKENQVLLIKGEIVVPQPKQVVKEWDLPG